MKPRERILAALNHEEPDRCPMQISFTPEFAERLRADLQMKGQRVHNPHGGGNTYELERALGEDMLLTSVGWANSYYQMKQYAPAMTGYLSLTNSKNNDAQAKAFYNLGNAFAAQKDYKNALLSYKYVLDHADPKSEVFQRALKNFVFLKQKFPPQQQKDDQKEEKDNKDEENKDQNKDQKDDKKEKEPKNPDNQQKQQQQQAQQQKPISPTDIENLLNLIEEEEKKHLTDKEKPTGKLIYPKIKY